MKVLEQDEELRGKLDYKADNGVGLYSGIYPKITFDTVYVRGEVNERDSNVCANCFKSISAAKERIQKIQEAVKEFNQQFYPSTDIEPDDIEVVIAE